MTQRPELVTLLLEFGADPNLQNNVGNSALHQAARWNRIDEIQILVEFGALLDLQNNAGKTALDLAVNDRVIELLQELGAG